MHRRNGPDRGRAAIIAWPVDAETIAARLWIIALTRATRPAAAWLCAVLGKRDLAEGFFEAYAAVGRKVGCEAVSLAAPESSALRDAGVARPLEGWALDDLTRVALLLSASLRLPAARFEAVVEGVLSRGGERERRAALGALELLRRPAPGRLEAVRS